MITPMIFNSEDSDNFDSFDNFDDYEPAGNVFLTDVNEG